MITPVAQKMAVSFENGPVSSAKFCITLNTITNARTGPISVHTLPAPLGKGLRVWGVGIVSVIGVT